MKKLFAILALVGVLASSSLYGQDSAAAAEPAAQEPATTDTSTLLLKKISLSMKY